MKLSCGLVSLICQKTYRSKSKLIGKLINHRVNNEKVEGWRMKYTDIAWDFDGTLFDTYPNLVRAFKEALEICGHTAKEDEIHLKMTISIRHAVTFYSEKYGLDPEEFRALHKKLEGFRPDLVTPYPGVRETLKAIKESGRRNHLYTNRDKGAVRYLEAYDLLQYFDGLITKEEMRELKPAPGGMIDLCRQYQVEPKQMLMVGDRAVDIDSAKNAGADACFYNTNGINVPEGTDFEVKSLKELLGHL